MKKLLSEVSWFLQQKLYIIAMSLTALCAYGFAITHYSIGIDDTAVSLYLEDGLEVVMGRWTVFLLNKLFHMSEFSPFMMELIGVLLFMLGITLFCVLLRRILGEAVDILGYTIFGCVFLSSPIISEVYIYYYHDGVDLGYILTALSLLAFLEALDRRGKKKIGCFVGSMLFIWAAVGCYESFLLLYILGIIVILFLRGMVGRERLGFSCMVRNLGIGALLAVGSVVLRTIMIPLMTAVFGLQDVEGLLAQRSLTEMFVLFRDREGLEKLVMLLKRFWMLYHVNAFAYLPIAVYEFAVFFIGGLSLLLAVKKKNLWYPVLYGGMLVTPVLLTIAEAKVTHYRSCQFLPFFAALGVFLCYRALAGLRKKTGCYVMAVFALILVFNQSAMMNKSFYVDYQKYQITKDTLNQVAYEIEAKYGNEIPVVFTGHYDVPPQLLSDYYLDYTSWRYRAIAAISDLVDENLKEKYFSYHGYCFVGEAQYPFIQWGLDAFDETNREMIAFLRMHGHSFTTITDYETLTRIREMAADYPGWPAEGSVSLQDGYVLVNFD
ncbi:MAG: glucosyltransferase domain-containing protein [Lachnospiraceae bacterium]|nr:glucosyltransferase domain-containing protein [Lachnospiraceae bacterium]